MSAQIKSCTNSRLSSQQFDQAVRSPESNNYRRYKHRHIHGPVKVLVVKTRTTMDSLKSLISQKRKTLQEDPLLNARPTKYMRKGELEKLKEEQEKKEREQKRLEQEATAKVRMKVYFQLV